MKKKASAQITIFLSLTLLLVLSIVFVSLESARAEGLKLRVATAANASIESVFAQYDRVLYEEFGLLMFTDKDGSLEDFKSEALKYAEKNSGSDWLSFDVNDIEITDYMKATDDSGEVFINAVAYYMKASGLAEEAIELSKSAKSNLSGSADDVISEDGEIDFSAIKSKIEDSDDAVAEAKKKAEEAAANEAAAAASEASAGGEASASGRSEADEASEKSGKAAVSEATDKQKADYSSIKNNFSNWKSKGILMLVVDDVEDISEEIYDKSELPSDLSDTEKERSGGNAGEIDATDKILLCEYFMRRFESYTSDGTNGLQLERLICGKDSDLSNAASIAKRLIAIRFAADYLAIKNMGEMTLEAAALATAIVGWTGVTSLVDAVKEIILVVWALGEAICDVKTLFAGKKVALIKNESNWNLSWENLIAGKLKTASGEGDEDGLSYEGYLRVLLYLKDKEEIAYRGMDIIQGKVRESEDAFRFSNCIYAANIKLSANASSLFPLLKKNFTYSYGAEAAYCYGSVEGFGSE